MECKKASIQCLSTCGGTSGSLYKHDFSTIVSLTELGQFALGDGFDDAAAADCNVRSYVFKVPTFEGGDSFLTVAARARVRSGMTAIDNDFCFKQRAQLRRDAGRARALARAGLHQRRVPPQDGSGAALAAAVAVAASSPLRVRPRAALAAAAARHAAAVLQGNALAPQTRSHAARR